MTEPVFHHAVSAEYADYLRDESRRSGRAESISFARDENEVRATLAACSARRTLVTIQGARTGIAAGSVPDGGHILNLSRMKRLCGLRLAPTAGQMLLAAEPGVALQELRAAVAARTFDVAGWTSGSREALSNWQPGAASFFPPDPTETSASIGGMAACNASGACSFFYGPTRRYVQSLRVALADGDLLTLERGRDRAAGRAYRVRTEGGALLQGALPRYRLPNVKNAAGYFVQDDMDLVDLFVGAEGTLGVITQAELCLLPLPPFRWGALAFLPSLPQALDLVRRVRAGAAQSGVVAIELFDERALELLRQQKASTPAFAELAAIPAGRHTGIYAEYHGAEEDPLMEALEKLSESVGVCGGAEDATIAASTEREMEALKFFRHAVPESVNLLIGERKKSVPGLTKLGTDMAVPDEHLEDIMDRYVRDLARAGLDYVIFGHVGNNHVHVNILPRSLADYEKGRGLYEDWAAAVVGMSGSVSAEHGIGKMKVRLLETMYGAEAVAQMRAVKRVFDPRGLLNRGDLFAPEDAG